MGHDHSVEQHSNLIKLVKQTIKVYKSDIKLLEQQIKNLSLDDAKEKDEKKKKNNETTGISAELAMCDFYELDYPEHLQVRSSKRISNQIKTCIKRFSKDHPEIKFTKHLGAENRKPDFELENEKVLSLKTNIKKGNKMCPQGAQGSRENFDKVFNLSPNQTDLDRKQFIESNVLKLVNRYWKELFCCDYLLWLYLDKQKWEYKFFNETMVTKSPFKDSTKFSFTRTGEDWNEGSTVKYDGISIGEFQFHNNRNCIKFRFILINVLNLIK
jgi:hypothetical protein